MFSREQEIDIERRLFNFVRKYGEYKEYKRKFETFLKNPDNYTKKNGVVCLVSTTKEMSDHLTKMLDAIELSLKEQADNINKPVHGDLTERIMYDVTTTPPEVISELIDVTCGFLTNALQISESAPSFEGFLYSDIYDNIS
jgi:hypothetical protein